MSVPLRIGVSACLLGREVRFDGGHKRDAFVAERLGRFAEVIPVCPEIEIGLGTPRESLRLVREEDGVHLVAPRSGADRTDAMRAFSEARTRHLAGLSLSGFVVKKGSPSCGLERVRVYGEGSPIPARDGTGLFAEALKRRLPGVPIEEEGRLKDPVLRDAFLVRVFARHRLLSVLAAAPSATDLMDFHAREKYLVLAHAPGAQQRLGRRIAEEGAAGAAAYAEAFLAALAQQATPGRHANVMQHMAGYVSDRIPTGDRQELADAIDAYRRGEVHRLVPLTLLRHYIRRESVDYLARQTWLQPYPAALEATV